MDQATLLLIFWVSLVFFLGCIAGYLARWSFAESRIEPSATRADDAGATATGISSTERAAAGPAGRANRKVLPFALAVWAVYVLRKVAARERRQAGGASGIQEPPESGQAALPDKAAAQEADKPVATEAEPAVPRASEATPCGPAPQSDRPQGLAAPRDGRADDLQRIKGIGPKLERTLNGLGFFHFDQIGAWTPAETRWMDRHLRFTGRIERDAWIDQARRLAQEKEKGANRDPVRPETLPPTRG